LVRFVGKSESMFKKTLSNNTMKIIQSTTIDPSWRGRPQRTGEQ